jgi:phage terminase large subunit-like protein
LQTDLVVIYDAYGLVIAVAASHANGSANVLEDDRAIDQYLEPVRITAVVVRKHEADAVVAFVQHTRKIYPRTPPIWCVCDKLAV